MPSVFEFMENPEIYVYETTLTNNPDILYAVIDYISLNPNPMLQNQQECYVYPSKAADILSLGTTYRALITKRTRKNHKTDEDETYYPHLDKLFRNVVGQTNIEESLLGYLNKVLVSLAKKTPQIYEYFKDNQDLLIQLIKDNRILSSLQEFWVTFLIESTMSLYIFLKNILIRGLMFRIIDDQDANNLAVYESLANIYEQFTKKLASKFLPEDEREELEQIAHNFNDEDFVTLLILKVSTQKPQKTYYIARILQTLIKNASNRESLAAVISTNHIQAFEDYFQGYEESSGFMEVMLHDQLEMLQMELSLSQMNVLELEHEANLLKRLLVYSSIHRKNSILHNLLVRMILSLADNNKIEVFKQINVIPFLMKNSQAPGARHAYGSTIWQICEIWHEHSQLYPLLSQQQIQFIDTQVKSHSQKLVGLSFYKPASFMSLSQDNFNTSTLSEGALKEKEETKPTEERAASEVETGVKKEGGGGEAKQQQDP